MTPFWAVVKRELWTVIRDRPIVISILIQFFIASFSSGLFLGMLQLYDVDTILRYSGGAIKIGVVNASESQLGVFIANHGMTVVPFETLEQAEAGFYNGKAIAIIDAPQETDGITEIRVFLTESNTISSIVRMVIQEPLKEYENYLRIQKGVDIRYTDLQGEPSISYGIRQNMDRTVCETCPTGWYELRKPAQVHTTGKPLKTLFQATEPGLMRAS